MRTKWTGGRQIPKCIKGNHKWKGSEETGICLKCGYDSFDMVYKR
jgi:hypothetical protein